MTIEQKIRKLQIMRARRWPAVECYLLDIEIRREQEAAQRGFPR
jgi:hypothetical protein